MWFVKNVSCQLGKSCDLYSTTSVFYLFLFFLHSRLKMALKKLFLYGLGAAALILSL